MSLRAPRVAENCGLQTTSVPPPFPVTVAPPKVTIERSPTRTPGPALFVIVADVNLAAELSWTAAPTPALCEIEPDRSRVEWNAATTPCCELLSTVAKTNTNACRATWMPTPLLREVIGLA